MLRRCRFALRGHSMEVEPWMGVSCYPITPGFVGGMPAVQPGYTHLTHQKPERPVRAVKRELKLLPVPYSRMDYLVGLENALALQRVENQISVTLSQLALGIRNADDFLEEHLLNREVRPSIYTLWFHEGGLREHQHVLSTLAAHHLVPLFSLVSYDVERGKMTALEAQELYEELMDNSTAQPAIVQRELANQMIRVHCLDGDIEGAKQIVTEMKAKNIRRTFVTYAPLFRLIRERKDVEGQLALLQFMYDTEGGPVQKFVFIDIPRMFYMFGVFIRYNWVAINISFSMLLSFLFLMYINFGTFTLGSRSSG